MSPFQGFGCSYIYNNVKPLALVYAIKRRKEIYSNPNPKGMTLL